MFNRNKKGMFDSMIVVAVSLVTFILVIGIGLLVVDNFAESQCPEAYTYYNHSTNLCQNASTNEGYGNTSTPGVITTMTSLKGYLGTGSGGLGTWVPAIIALVIGVLFIAAIMGLRNLGGRQPTS